MYGNSMYGEAPKAEYVVEGPIEALGGRGSNFRLCRFSGLLLCAVAWRCCSQARFQASRLVKALVLALVSPGQDARSAIVYRCELFLGLRRSAAHRALASCFWYRRHSLIFT
jgi:hypothetical protein